MQQPCVVVDSFYRRIQRPIQIGQICADSQTQSQLIHTNAISTGCRLEIDSRSVGSPQLRLVSSSFSQAMTKFAAIFLLLFLLLLFLFPETIRSLKCFRTPGIPALPGNGSADLGVVAEVEAVGAVTDLESEVKLGSKMTKSEEERANVFNETRNRRPVGGNRVEDDEDEQKMVESLENEDIASVANARCGIVSIEERV